MKKILIIVASFFSVISIANAGGFFTQQITSTNTFPSVVTAPYFTSSNANATSTLVNLLVGHAASSLSSNFVVSGNTNNYYEENIQNLSAGASASADYVVTGNLGNESVYYTDLGQNSSGYSVGTWTMSGANDSYLYASDGALTVGTASSTNTNAGVIFHTGGTLASNVRMTITQPGLVGIGTTTPPSLLSVSSQPLGTGVVATTTVDFGDYATTTSRSCYNTKNSAGAAVSWYINAANAIVVEANRCK